MLHLPHLPSKLARVKGTLESASDDTVVLLADNASMRSLPRAWIRNLQIYQPPRMRYLAQICSGLSAGFMFGWLPHKLDDQNSPHRFI